MIKVFWLKLGNLLTVYKKSLCLENKKGKVMP